MRAEAVGNLTAAIAARDEYAQSWVLFRDQQFAAVLNSNVEQAKANIQAIDDRLAATFGFQAGTPRLRAGDEALQWDYATKFLVALQYAWDHDQFTGEMKEQVEDLLNTVKDPAAMAQFVAVVGGVALLKKGACKVGVGGVAGALFTAKEAADMALTLSPIKSELDGVTYTNEVANAAPHVAEFTANLIKELTFAELMKRIKCFVAGTQIAISRQINADGQFEYTTRNIEDLRPGDLVLAREEFGDAVHFRRVTDTFKRVATTLRVLTFESESGAQQTLRTTDEHPFWTANHHEFRPAHWLEPGDTFLGLDGQIQTLTATESESHPAGVFVYNFSVEADPTYFVSATQHDGPVLVHNSCGKDSGSEPAPDSIEMRPYGGRGGGHHTPPKKAFDGAPGYDKNTALAIPNEVMKSLKIQHPKVTGAQNKLYSAFAKTGKPITWEVIEQIETKSLIAGGGHPAQSLATVRKAIQALKAAGVSGPTRIPWGQ